MAKDADRNDFVDLTDDQLAVAIDDAERRVGLLHAILTFRRAAAAMNSKRNEYPSYRLRAIAAESYALSDEKAAGD